MIGKKRRMFYKKEQIDPMRPKCPRVHDLISNVKDYFMCFLRVFFFFFKIHFVWIYIGLIIQIDLKDT